MEKTQPNIKWGTTDLMHGNTCWVCGINILSKELDLVATGKTITLHYDSNLMDVHLKGVASIKKLVLNKEQTLLNHFPVGTIMYIAVAKPFSERWESHLLINIGYNL